MHHSALVPTSPKRKKDLWERQKDCENVKLNNRKIAAGSLRTGIHSSMLIMKAVVLQNEKIMGRLLHLMDKKCVPISP